MRNDYEINGIGTISAGEYARIDVNGSGQCVGPINAEEIIISGCCKTQMVNCDILDVEGYYKGLDFTSASNTIINGGSKFKKLKTKIIEVDGLVKVEESLFFNKAVISGACKVGNNCEGTEFVTDGVINIGGMLSADTIDITLRNKCLIKEIGGEKISVKTGKYKSRKILGFSFSSKPILVSEIIEGDDIFLENTYCKIVRGDKVVIGKGCKIDKIEYKTSIHISENSSVNNSTSI